MKRLLKVTGMTALLTLLRMIMGFVIAKVVAIYTGPTGMALLGQVQSMVISLNGVITSPVGSGLVRYTTENKSNFVDCAPWWRASIQWVIVLSGIVIPIGLFFADYVSTWLFEDSSYAWIVMVTVCTLPLSAVGTLCNSIINGRQLYKRYISLGMISTLLSSSVMLIMIITYNIKGALLAAALQSALIGFAMLVLNLRQPWLKLSYWWGKTDRSARMAIGGYMLMAVTSALTVPLSLVFVRNIIIEQVGWDSAGQWQAVWRISQVYLGVVTMSLSTYYLPCLASLNDVDSIVKEIHKTALFVIPIVILMALGLYFLRDVIVYILYTEEFREARNLFAFQLSGDVIKIASWLYAYPMLSRGATKWFVTTEIISSLLFVALGYVFISIFSLEGAVIAYLCNYVLYFLFVFFNVKRFSN